VDIYSNRDSGTVDAALDQKHEQFEQVSAEASRASAGVGSRVRRQ
jgi:hypothetical protein